MAILLCRNSDVLNAGQPANYGNSYIDLMRTYRDAARTAMSIADAAGIASPHRNAVVKSWRVAIRLESTSWNPPCGFTRDSIPTRGPSSRP